MTAGEVVERLAVALVLLLAWLGAVAVLVWVYLSTVELLADQEPDDFP